jgi:K+/H+ antiporter YhaU regulatory subunit KhtT
MIFLVTLLMIVAILLALVRIGAVALTMTGLSRDVANFQAMSAFLSVGFTTAESETIMTHPIRRRIVSILMLCGTAGVGSGIAAFVIAFARSNERDLLTRAAFVLGGLILLIIIARSKRVDQVLTRVIQKALASTTRLKVQDYEALLELELGYGVSKIVVRKGGWMADRSPGDLNLTGEGIIILNLIRRNGAVLGTPSADTAICVGDRLVCYGVAEDVARLQMRKAGPEGNRDHAAGLSRHAERRKAEQTVEKAPKQAEPGVPGATGNPAQ